MKEINENDFYEVGRDGVKKILTPNDKKIDIIEYDNKDIGFYNGEVVENGDYEIGNICILAEYQGKGIGTKILEDIINQNKECNIKLQYFKQNPVGRLYERLGFVLVGETKYHYQVEKSKIKQRR